MTKLASAFGEKYQAQRRQLLTRTFELGGHIFKVKIPLVVETQEIYQRIQNPDEQAIEAAYQEIAAPLLAFKDTPDGNVTFLDNDIVVDGRSLREAAKNKITTQMRITEFIKLLIPEDSNATLDDITYADIEAEFPFSVQMALIEKIGEAISPSYKETRGN
jgi:hypothetical protein